MVYSRVVCPTSCPSIAPVVSYPSISFTICYFLYFDYRIVRCSMVPLLFVVCATMSCCLNFCYFLLCLALDCFSLTRWSIGNNLPTSEIGVRFAYTLPSPSPDPTLWDYTRYVFCCLCFGTLRSVSHHSIVMIVISN